MTRNTEASVDDYEEDFMELPGEEEEEEELPVKRSPAVRPFPVKPPGHGALGKRSSLSELSGTRQTASSTPGTMKRPVVRNGLKNGNTTLDRTGTLRKTASSTFNGSTRFPLIRRNELSNGIPRRPPDLVSERVLSARANRVRDVENERNLLRVQVQELKREVQTLNQMLRRQSKALGLYEGSDDKLPTLLRQSEEDSRVTREQLRVTRQKHAQLREHYRQMEVYSQALEKERDTFLAMVRDKDLQDGKILKNERDELMRQLDDALAKKTEMERRISTLQKSNARERQFSDSRFKEHMLLFEKTEAENAALKEQLRSALAYKERSRTHVQSRERKTHSGVSGAGEAHFVPVRDRSAVGKKVDFEEDERRLLRQAKPSFIQQFNGVTSPSPSPPRQFQQDSKMLQKKSDSTAPTPDSLTKETMSGMKNTWKSRTSPDLLRDHEERIVFADLPLSSSSSLASSSSVLERERKVRLKLESPISEDDSVSENAVRKSEQRRSSEVRFSVDIEEDDAEEHAIVAPPPKQENALKNDLLEKIRMLDVSRKEVSTKSVEESSAQNGDGSVQLKSNGEFSAGRTSLGSSGLGLSFSRDILNGTTSSFSGASGSSGRHLRSLASDDEIEEIEFF
ncbi:hypothetical protein BV898_16092 [Hypsibius exemplaris]|uniref:Lebercilin domain-containing protein n=1 Tax=Hypsibius exemplaris TaxID=2072580 RepID=A0A9X6RKY8_HYPEX|nr:hypothetical protein BV898_16092 [Hypsibius exemplaris]